MNYVCPHGYLETLHLHGILDIAQLGWRTIYTALDLPRHSRRAPRTPSSVLPESFGPPFQQKEPRIATSIVIPPIAHTIVLRIPHLWSMLSYGCRDPNQPPPLSPAGLT